MLQVYIYICNICILLSSTFIFGVWTCKNPLRWHAWTRPSHHSRLDFGPELRVGDQLGDAFFPGHSGAAGSWKISGARLLVSHGKDLECIWNTVVFPDFLWKSSRSLGCKENQTPPNRLRSRFSGDLFTNAKLDAKTAPLTWGMVSGLCSKSGTASGNRSDELLCCLIRVTTMLALGDVSEFKTYPQRKLTWQWDITI